MHRRRRIALSVSATVALAACGGSPADPATALKEAIEATTAAPFAFELHVEVDEDLPALDGAPPAVRQQLAAVQGSAIKGVIAGGSYSVTIEALGTEFAELRSIAGTGTYAKVDVPTLVALVGGEPPSAERAREQGAAEGTPLEFIELGVAAIEGRWVGITGGGLVDIGTAIATAGAPAGAGADVDAVGDAYRDILTADLATSLDRFARVTEGEPTDDARRLQVALLPRELARAFSNALLSSLRSPLPPEYSEATAEQLGDLPAELPGISVAIAGGVITQVALDVGEMATALQPSEDLPAGAVRMVIDLSDHGGALSVTPPDGAVTVELDALLDAMRDAMTGFGGLSSGGTTTYTPPPPAHGQLRGLANAQETYHVGAGHYTDDVSDLVGEWWEPVPGGRYGTCLYDEGSDQLFVVGAQLPGEPQAYRDATGTETSGEDPLGLGCVPELAPLS